MTVTKPLSTVRIKPNEAEAIKKKTWKLSEKNQSVIKESDLVHFVIENFIDDVDIEDGKLIKKK